MIEDANLLLEEKEGLLSEKEKEIVLIYKGLCKKNTIFGGSTTIEFAYTRSFIYIEYTNPLDPDRSFQLNIFTHSHNRLSIVVDAYGYDYITQGLFITDLEKLILEMYTMAKEQEIKKLPDGAVPF